MIAILAAVVFVIIATAAFVSEYRSTVTTVFNPAVSLWRSLRLIMTLLLAYGLLISGRTTLQLLGLLIVAFGTVYILVKQPYRRVQRQVS